MVVPAKLLSVPSGVRLHENPLLCLIIPFIVIGTYLPDHKPQFREMMIRVGKGPNWIAVSDVNHDRNPDIVVANGDSGTLNVLLGNGKGQFHEATGSPLPVGHLPNDIAIADMNEWGRESGPGDRES
jgi:FG-GAP-like repeat